MDDDATVAGQVVQQAEFVLMAIFRSPSRPTCSSIPRRFPLAGAVRRGEPISTLRQPLRGHMRQADGDEMLVVLAVAPGLDDRVRPADHPLVS